MSRDRTRPRRRAAGAAVLCAVLLTGCTAPGDAAARDAPRSWERFGPFERPRDESAGVGVPGPALLRLPDERVVRLDAADLLGTGLRLPARDDYTILSEEYSYTHDGDGDEPLIVGLVRTKRQMHYRGYSEYEYVTFVLGISAEPEPREVTRTRIIRAGEHTAEFAGRSDLGVVAVLLEGVLDTGSAPDSRVVGVDAVRGTDVWVKEHGYSVYGEGSASFYVAPTPESCASEVQRYEVATGIVEERETYPNTADAPDGLCRRASEDARAE